MKAAYPVIINTKTFVIYVPDFDISTQGIDVENCMEMAREAIGLSGISLQTLGKSIPTPSDELPNVDDKSDLFATFVSVDFDDYRR